MENLDQLNKNVQETATNVAKNYVETAKAEFDKTVEASNCLLYTSPSPRDS